MKKYFKFVTDTTKLILISMSFLLCMSSCSNSSDEGTDSGNTSDNSNLSETSKKFLGFWQYSITNTHIFAFFSDGTAWHHYLGNSYTNRTWGQWTYNETTNILATTVASWQFSVTGIFDNVWTAVTLSTSSVINASRASAYNVFYYYLLNEATWTTEDGVDYDPFDETINISGFKTQSLRYSNGTFNGDTLSVDFTLSFYTTSSRTYYYSKTGTIQVLDWDTFNPTVIISGEASRLEGNAKSPYTYPLQIGTYKGTIK